MARSLAGQFGRLEFKVITAEKLLDEYGVNPSQWVDFRCMTGDTSDGLPGAPGIGPKTARDVLVACGTLDKFYEEPFKAPVSVIKRNALLEFRSQVPLMRNLITLRPDALLEVPV
jgi:DNA polymerase-1